MSLTAYQPFKANEKVVSRSAFQAHAIAAEDQDSGGVAVEDNRRHALLLARVLNAGNTQLRLQTVTKQFVACFVSWVRVHCTVNAGRRGQKDQHRLPA